MPRHPTTIPATAHPEIEFDPGLAFDPPALAPDAPAIQGEPVTYKGERILTTEMAADAFKVGAGLLTTNYHRHRERFTEGKHFYKVEGAELRAIKDSMSLRDAVGPNARSLILWTERGIARHAKMLDSDEAWTVFETLEDTYFRVKETPAIVEAPALPNFADPASAARAWAEQYEGRVLAERKKAEIGSRREATAMATAAAEKRKAEKLKIELDIATAWATVRRMEAAYPDRKFPYTPLKNASLAMALEIKSVPDQRYTKLNSYHALVWRAVYDVDVPGWTGSDQDGEAVDAH